MLNYILRPPYFCRPCLSRYYPSRWLWQEEYVLSLVMSGSVPDEPCSVSGLLLLRCSSADATSQVNWCYVAGHGLQCGRSAFLGRTCDTICLTAAISVASPQQTIGPATPEGQTGDARWKASITRCGRPATPEGQTCDPGVRDQRRRSGRPVTQGGGDLLQKVSERPVQRLFLVRWHLRLNLAAYQVYYCYVAGWLTLRRRSRL